MITFPNCKINLGLHVTEKRADGYHNIETVFYPVGWSEALEVLEDHEGKDLSISQSGISIACSTKENLIYKAWHLINSEKKLPPLKVHVHKNIPIGAGLGGGSADAAYFINLLNQKYSLNLTIEQRTEIASRLGSDCAFFINNRPVLAVGRGDKFSKIQVDLSGYYILIVYPAIHSGTREAYSGLIPRKPSESLRKVIEQTEIIDWKNHLVNDFETSIFKKYPAISALKRSLYDNGALYASLSGSGSAVYGIFKTTPRVEIHPSYQQFLQKPGQ